MQYVVLCGFFNDTLSRSVYVTLNDKINEQWIDKYTKGSGSGLI
jgi:hypothetical protein